MGLGGGLCLLCALGAACCLYRRGGGKGKGDPAAARYNEQYDRQSKMADDGDATEVEMA